MSKIIFKYFIVWATQKDKRVDLNMCSSNLQIVLDILFCVAQNTKHFVLKFYMVVDYDIDYVQIYLYFFETYKYNF
jgi:hypothetical protein